LAFRGSDNPTDLINYLETSDETYFGIEGINKGIVREFKGLLHPMLSKGEPLLKDVVEDSCKSSFVVVGHSIGGALGQLFAAIVNRRDDPLSWPRKVDALYLFGSTPVARTRLRNDQSADGCFRDKSHYNVKQMPLLGRISRMIFLQALASSTLILLWSQRGRQPHQNFLQIHDGIQLYQRHPLRCTSISLIEFL